MTLQGPMEAPVCLIANSGGRKLEVKLDALEILNRIDKPVVVVAMVGFYRTGKSYLMNQLAGKKKGFSWGVTIQSHTKGIWMWCLPHPKKPDHTLVLLDTEGLGDPEKGDSNIDSAIFTLAVLLSSVLVYNSKGTINQRALEELCVVTELADRIKVKARGKENKVGEEDGASEEESAHVFPAFVWVVRDFTLQLEIDGKDLTDSEYLEHMLKPKKGVAKQVMEYNLPRECIRSFFPTRNCFVFEPPMSGDQISKMESLPENALDPKFVAQTRKFSDYVFEKVEVKKVEGGHELNGRTFSILVNNLVTTIVNGGAPCIENAVLSMAKSENEVAMQDAEEHYKTQMEELVKFPAEVQELSDLHGKCEQEALDIFMKQSFKDKDHHYQDMLKNKVQDHYLTMVGKNENVSFEKCQSLCQSPLKNLSSNLEENVTSGVDFPAGGHKADICGREEVMKQSQESLNKVGKETLKLLLLLLLILLPLELQIMITICLLLILPVVLFPFLDLKLFSQFQVALKIFLARVKGETESILKASLTKAEKRLAEEEAKAALIEQEKKAAEEKASEAAQLLEDQEHSHQESVAQLQRKMEEEAENIKKAAEKKALQAEKLLKDQERSHQENLVRLEAKMREDAEKQKMEAEKKELQAEQLLKDQERSHQENLLRLEAKMREDAAKQKMEAEKKELQAEQPLKDQERSHQVNLVRLEAKMREDAAKQKMEAEKKELQAEQLLKDREHSHQVNLVRLEAKMREDAAKQKMEAEKKELQAQQLLKDRERSHQEGVAQLQRKMENAENTKKKPRRRHYRQSRC